MRKILVTIITIILLTLTLIIVLSGISIGNLQLLGIKGISEKDKLLDDTIKYVAIQVNSSDNSSKLNNLNKAYKKLMEAKSEYEKKATDENGNYKADVQEYEIEYLWKQLGDYARKEGVKINLSFPQNNSITKTHDINFTITGSYIGITDFLYLLENDDKLPFKIEEFKLLPSSGDALVATFSCKDIKINIEEMENVVNNEETTTDNKTENTNEANKNEGNTTNSTQNTTSTNTTTNTTSNVTNNTTTNTTSNTTKNTTSNTTSNTTNNTTR